MLTVASTPKCTACGSLLPPAAKFCPECGHPVAAAKGHETTKDVVERLVTAAATLEGERKFVTVLFADLKGSLELIADRDPEDARKLLDPALEHMCDAVEKFGAPLARSWATGSRRCSGRRCPGRTMPSAPATPRCPCSILSGITATTCSARTACRSRSASASIPARWRSVSAATACT